MHVTILSLGTLGDVAPFVGLGAGLVARGHRVRLATYARYAEPIAGAGLDHHVLPGDPARLMNSEAARRIARASGRPAAYDREQRALEQALAAKARRVFDEAVEACRGTDLIVYSLTAAFAGSIAEAMELPAVQGFLVPVTPTRAFAPLLAKRAQSRLGGLGNLAAHLVASWRFGNSFRQLQDDWRRESLGLPPLPVRLPYGGPLVEADRRRRPLLYGISPSVLPRPADWGDWIEMTGFWPQPLPPGWQPPTELEAFLEAGEPPLCIGFSSAGGGDGERMTGIVLEALAKVGRRAVLLSGWGALGDSVRSPLVHVAEKVPHAWLAPRVAAMVHAGGAGTSHEVFRAGVPSVVVPFTGDQFFWAARAAALGTAPPPLPWWELTAQQLAEAIETVLGDPGYARAASGLAGRIAGEDGVARAVAAIERQPLAAAHSAPGASSPNQALRTF
ncbi:UDP:flavonoid glycosyltransferase YjiC, YdhE family [Tistlia consotensis]|uniref:UDP:flavonoid glycosyltransferase YjiC, YdhE family n=1 Tax=Tistlia consotensis USBA 355 TaxID=560819 RepID=A0A1Y6BJB6_9PROT|nr:glycosyltransferase [Tistlia consotensis]SMF03881.1 UDP:flavonoid glycosyltransferase YjiC, YdhE family [Tistlia consotensis USBA 355]SNR54129.1 UDP:flavonoid glycosyltransferase YjiC, YdhE family [Tistlia consotensis]